MDVQGCIDQSVINGTSCTNTTNNLFTSSILNNNTNLQHPAILALSTMLRFIKINFEY